MDMVKMTYLLRIKNNIQLNLLSYTISKWVIIESYYSRNKFKTI